MALQIYPVTLLDSNQVIQYVYDESTQALRTTALATIIGGDLVVDIDGVYAAGTNPDPDNIGLIGHVRAASPGDSDQTNRITSITNGSIHALDTSIHHGDGSEIDSTNPLFVDTSITASSPTTYNVSAAIAGTEYSQVIPAGTKRFMAKVRSGDARMQFAYVSGQSGTNYTTVRVGCFYEEINLNLTASITFYFQTNKATQTLEMLVWS
jgi:glucose dehydrogenase